MNPISAADGGKFAEQRAGEIERARKRHAVRNCQYLWIEGGEGG
ncbi:hypothetical protein [Frankia sp. ACN1ag]|nr:hypothetical protein [Frankia sp. ACN1ag]